MKKDRAEFNISYALQPDWLIRAYEEQDDIVILVIYKEGWIIKFDQSHRDFDYHVHIGKSKKVYYPGVKTREGKITKAFSVLKELISKKLIQSGGDIRKLSIDWTDIEKQIINKEVSFGSGRGVRQISGVSRIIMPQKKRAKTTLKKKQEREMLEKLSDNK